MQRVRARGGDRVTEGLLIRPSMADVVRCGGIFTLDVVRRGRRVVGPHYHGVERLSRDVFHNLITNAGLTYLTGSALLAVTVDTTWFVGLVDASPTFAAGDTLASHAGWTEATEYDEVTRRAWTGVAGSPGAATNVASPAVFTINATISLEGAFIAGVNTGTSGTLLCEGLMSTVRNVVDNDVVTVTYAYSQVDDGV